MEQVMVSKISKNNIKNRCIQASVVTCHCWLDDSDGGRSACRKC